MPNEEVVANATAWAHEIAERAPLSVRATKDVMRASESSSWAQTFDHEARLQTDLVGSPDNVEGVQAFFEKRKPEFKG